MAAGRLLSRGEPGAAVYTRASPGGREFTPGLSDIDLAIVLATDEQADRVREARRRAGADLARGGARRAGPDTRAGAAAVAAAAARRGGGAAGGDRTRARAAPLPEPALATVIPMLIRLSERIAAVLAAQIEDAPVTEVALTGERAPLPLADWRALAAPPAADGPLLPLAGDPADPGVLGAAVNAHSHRAVSGHAQRAAPAAAGRGVRADAHARAPVPGQRSGVVRAARRRRHGALPRRRGLVDPRRRPPRGRRARGTAAVRDRRPRAAPDRDRAALLHDSVRRGEPELVLTAAEALARLPGGDLAALREQVLALPAYASASI